jgi:hypothetical protein
MKPEAALKCPKVELLASISPEVVEALEEAGLKISMEPRISGPKVELQFPFVGLSYCLSYFKFKHERNLTIFAPYRNSSQGQKTVIRWEIDAHSPFPKDLSPWLLASLNKDRDLNDSLK